MPLKWDPIGGFGAPAARIGAERKTQLANASPGDHETADSDGSTIGDKQQN